MTDLEAAAARVQAALGSDDEEVLDRLSMEDLWAVAKAYLRLTDLASRGEIDAIAESLGIDLNEYF